MAVQYKCGTRVKLTFPLTESRQVTQNLCHHCSYSGLCVIHVRKRCILCCWLVNDSPSYNRITALIAHVFTVPKDEIESSKLTIASLFFTKVFGNSGAVRGLNFLIALASFGNMIAVIIGISRRIRECGRQGVLPWTTFWVSTKPFGTPLGPYLVIWGLTMLMILAIPAGDAFTFSTFSLLSPRQNPAGRSCNANTQKLTI
jgi:Amino acid transporters